MSNLGMAQAKWERKMANIGGKWANATHNKGSDYCAGLSEFIGAPVSGSICEAYNQGVNAVSATAYQSSVAGKGAKWAQNYVRGINS
jgi:hypothetical protein